MNDIVTIPKQLARICDKASGAVAIKTAIIVCNDLYQKYEKGEKHIFLAPLRSDTFKSYAWPAAKYGKGFVTENLLGKTYEGTQIRSRYINRNDKFFKYKTIDVPEILTSKNIPIRSVYFYLKLVLYCQDKNKRVLNFYTKKDANDKEIEFLKKFYILPNKKVGEDEFRCRFKYNHNFIYEFKNIIKKLEELGLIKVDDTVKGKFTVEILQRG